MNLWKNRRFMQAAVLLLAFVLTIAAGRMIFAQDERVNALISNAASVSCATIATIFFLEVWRATSGKDVSTRIWGLITIALVLWTIAETIWGFYEVVLEQPVPYPSIADLFWIVGYVPLFLAILTQYRLYQITPTRQQKSLILLIVLGFSIIGGLVIIGPIIGGFDPERLLESLLNVAYPTLDLILLILTSVIIFALGQGRFASTWRVLGLGLVIMSVADLLFSYTSWNEIYNPDGQLNGITLLTDSLFYLSYLTLGLGAYVYKLTAETLPKVNINIDLQALTKSNVLIFVDRRSKIISLSDNFLNLVGTQYVEQYVKMPLSQALGIDDQTAQRLVTETLERGSLSTQPLTVQPANGKSKEVWLTSLAVYDEQGQFVSIAIVLRTNFDPQFAPERLLTEHQKMLINFYLTKAGTNRSEETRVIKTYFHEQISLLYSLVQQFSGTSAADRLLAHLNEVAGSRNWQFNFSREKIGIPEEYEGESLAGQVSTLLQEAKRFAGDLTDLKVIEHEMKILDNNLSADTLRHVDKYLLRSAAAPAM
jgi:hypothetical protein